jgi:hypothetical protein
MKKMMIRQMRITLAVVMVMMAVPLLAQGTHDDDRMNQFLVSHTGAGSLQPATYYQVFHRSYQSDATETNKLILAAAVKAVLINEVPDAKSIDSALVKRAVEEGLRVTDRSVDIAWLSEGSKINKRMSSYESLINKIIPLGGSLEDYQAYKRDYDKITCEIRAIQDAYLDNSQRTREYAKIYEDVLQSELDLVDFLRKTRSIAKAKEDYEKAKEVKAPVSRTRQQALHAHTRWRNAFIAASHN